MMSPIPIGADIFSQTALTQEKVQIIVASKSFGCTRAQASSGVSITFDGRFSYDISKVKSIC